MTRAAELHPASTVTADRVVVIGGGASGTLTALQLLRADPHVHVTVFEPTGRLGCGAAYGTTDGRHLLNVRAGNMSAFPDVTDDLLAWAAERGRPLSAMDFLPRREYGEYLRDRLAEVAGGRCRVVAERVEDVVPLPGGGYRVIGSTTSVTSPSVVLAHGNAAPPALSVEGRPLPRAPWHITDPWRSDWISRLAPDATVVIVGTGLTGVDTAISVLEEAPGRRAVMVSRHGLLPQSHIDCQCVAWVSPLPSGTLTADQLAAIYREQLQAAAVHGVSWQHVVDGFRGSTPSIWARLPREERERFLTVYGRTWEVHRHRMAPQIVERLDALQADGRLQILRGRLDAVEAGAPYPIVQVGEERLTAHAVVNCTGPQTDVTRSDNPLLRALLRRGLATADELRLGLSCTPRGELLDPAGQLVPGLLTVGPPRKGTLYETTAIPEIRVQAAEVAAQLRGPRSLKSA